MSPGRARTLAAALGRWALDGREGSLRWAVSTTVELLAELDRLEKRDTSLRLWDPYGYPFARMGGGCCLHTRGCPPRGSEVQPLTRAEAEAFLRQSHERRRCTVCAPDIRDPPWVRVQSAGGQVRWHLADAEEAR